MAGNEPFEIGLVKAASTAKLRQVLFFLDPGRVHRGCFQGAAHQDSSVIDQFRVRETAKRKRNDPDRFAAAQLS